MMELLKPTGRFSLNISLTFNIPKEAAIGGGCRFFPPSLSPSFSSLKLSVKAEMESFSNLRFSISVHD